MPANLEQLREGDMSAIGPAYPAQIVVSQTEVKLAADETANATATTIRCDQQHVEAAQEVEAAAEAKIAGVDLVA